MWCRSILYASYLRALAGTLKLISTFEQERIEFNYNTDPIAW